MINEMTFFKGIPGFYKIILLNVLRNTPGVIFDNVPTQALPRIDAIDRVIHESRLSRRVLQEMIPGSSTLGPCEN